MIEVQMPQLGESVAEGTVTQWHVKVGEYVTREQTLLEVATDKADSEVPSPSDGLVVELAAAEGDIIATGGLLCKIDETAAKPAGGASTPAPKADAAAAAAPAAVPPAPASASANLSSPSTRQLAREKGVNLGGLSGTGERGRVTRDDVTRAAQGGAGMSLPPEPSRATPPPPRTAPARGASPAAMDLTALMNDRPIAGVGFRSYKVPPYVEKPGDKIVPFSRRRRITADHMVYSSTVSPHVVTVAEVDLHATAQLRDAHKAEMKRQGVPLTFLSFVVQAIIKGLREFPNLNSRVLDDSFVVQKNINVGIAVDTPSGLLVANIKQADQLSLRGIAMGIADLAVRARNGKITADDLMGTTFTVSNPGRQGNLFGGAIISQPNAAILRVGEIKKRAVVVTKDGDDFIAIHPVMFMALSYDHRIIDGVEANSFLWRTSQILSTAEFEL